MNWKLKESRNIIQKHFILELQMERRTIGITQHTDKQLLDFYHVTEYLAKAAYAIYPKGKSARKLWLSKRCSQLKHEENAAHNILEELVTYPIIRKYSRRLNCNIDIF